MKEKLKKVFTNKEFWTGLIGCLVLLLSIALSYSLGFKYGIFIDNTIRTELIEKAVDDAKNGKKHLKSNQYEYVAIPYGTNTTDSIVFDVGFIVEELKNYYTDIINSNFISAGSSAYLCADLSFSDNLAYGKVFYFYRNYNSTYDFRLHLVNGSTYSINNGAIVIDNAYNTPIICSISSSGVNNISDYYFGSYFIDSYYSSFNSKQFGISNLQLFDLFNIGAFLLPNTTDAYNAGYDAGYNDYTDSDEYREQMEHVYQNGINIGYQSGVIEGINEYKSSQEYKDVLQAEYDKGKDEGYDIGYQARQDSVEDQEQVTNNIWTILEKGITSVLNVLSFEILPGIPLFVCIAVPILLGLILWVVKMGGS